MPEKLIFMQLIPDGKGMNLLLPILLLTVLMTLVSCNENFRITSGASTTASTISVTVNRLSGTYAYSTHYLHSNGKLYSWGANWDGQLGNSDPGFVASPVPVEVDASHLGLSNQFKYLATSGYYNYHMCAIHLTGKILCWGANWTGECGVGNNTDLCDELTEIKMDHLPEANDFLMVSVGQETSCALHTNQKIFCWGRNSAGGQLGTGDIVNHFEPTEIDMSLVSENNQFKFVSVSETNGCGIHNNGKIFCWGWNTDGQLGNGTLVTSVSPTEIDMSASPEGNDFIAVAAGYHTCGIHANGKLFCWGTNGNGELGVGSIVDSSLPLEVDMSSHFKLNSFTEVRISSNSTCAIHLDQSLYCWGDNGFPAISGSVVQETLPFPYDMSPQAVSDQFKNITVDSEGWTICGLHQNDKLYCSGKNSNGQLGDNTIIDSTAPIEVDMSGM